MWIRCEVPALRVVDAELWVAAQERLAASRRATLAPRQDRTSAGAALAALRRPPSLLSGLVRCGLCGGNYAVAAQERRLRCTNNKERGTCTNNRSVREHDLEDRVFAAFRERLLSVDMVEAFVAAYRAEAQEWLRRQNAERRRLGAEQQTVVGRIRRIMDAIAAVGHSKALLEELATLEARQAQLEADAQAAERPLEVPDLDPDLTDLYRRRVEDLRSALADPETTAAAREALRALLVAITISPPPEPRGKVLVALEGCLEPLSRAGQIGPGKTGIVSLVAASGLEPLTPAL
ncbi:hypothetical protein G3576_21385 [Roseomonas stagni]|uniref:Recombinase zinc beta ribbon domain-containing protein n=1 Tax=Falsiroseomonas algicola TaxID=2716930 RepID=A0A6M1LRD3_9PROT|nr:hypothetical protein [Falsiroseomonas algicola]